MVLKRISKVISALVTGILCVILVIVLAFAVSSRISGGTPKVLGYQLLSVLSGSMEPGIHTGSVIFIHPGINPVDLKVGNVVTYRATEDRTMLITHRIKEISGSGQQLQFVTKGDANDAPDPAPVPASSIVGEYTNITIPYVGYALNFAKSKAGIISLLIVPGVLLIVWQLISLFMTIARTQEEETPKDPVRKRSKHV